MVPAGDAIEQHIEVLIAPTFAERDLIEGVSRLDRGHEHASWIEARVVDGVPPEGVHRSKGYAHKIIPLLDRRSRTEASEVLISVMGHARGQSNHILVV